jgi:23S rRNA (cytidine1920-2'-O)/16S rRNA (cytidine1409-2'-O)-methyltransferase
VSESRSGKAGPGKTRLDVALVERGLAESRAKAQALIMAGKVYSGEKKLDKAGLSVAPEIPIEVRGAPHPWVSRGGMKLAHALARFGLSLEGRVVLDVGASTGGFTDVALQSGAAKVYAVDVGRGQLHWKLRTDPRVVVMEGVNARTLGRERIPEPVDAIVTDASFIGLEVVLPAPLALAAPGCVLVALIKPQFEVGPERVGKGGIVRDPALWEETCVRIEAFVARQPGWRVLGITPSPIEGRDGNREFLIAAVREE